MAQRRTQRLVLGRSVANALLAALSARPAAALLTAPKVHLAKTVVSVTPDRVPGDFTEADYTGYAAIDLPALAGPVRENADVEALLANVNFIAPNPLAVTNTIVGYYITSSDGTVFYGGEMFDTPVPLLNPYDYLDLELVIPVATGLQLAA